MGFELLVIGGIVLAALLVLVWWGIRYEQQKATLIHTERRLALERGVPLPDAEVARCTALGWIGTVVPVFSLGVAAGVTFLLVPPHTPEPSLGGLLAVWSACGVVAVSGVVAVVIRLRSAPVRSPEADSADASASNRSP
ncbi:MAG: hypothetical protein NZU63_02660 [Gemmataceae bacterium]|nr:hypothetical protein [Gemmataceae bacterium]MDW8242702.1 hypothetical protein [Thermogemmata sp.]